MNSLAQGNSVIGHSALGQPLRIEHSGRSEAPLRLLILAGQHGDEPLARQAASGVSDWLKRNFKASKVLQTFVLENANPDGAANSNRKNAQGYDLNRDHQLLRSAESEALHRFVREWRPHLVLDMHTYPTRRKRLLKKGWQYCHDVFFDIPTHPAIVHPTFALSANQNLESWIHELEEQGFLAGRYSLITKTMRVRHSTPDVVDARNALTLRYGAWTVLLEGRQPTKQEEASASDRTCEAMEAGVRTIVGWALRNVDGLIARDNSAERNRKAVIGCHYGESPEPCRMSFFETASQTIRQVTLPGHYTPRIVPTRSIDLPVAYAIPRDQTRLLSILERHGFAPMVASDREWPHAECNVEEYHITRVEHSTHERRPPKALEVVSRIATRSQDEDLLFSARSDAGRALAVHLEPYSKFALHRHPESGISLVAGETYPIRRITIQSA